VTHRGAGRVRGVSRGLVVTVVAVLVVAAAVVGWIALRHHIARDDQRTAAACLDGTSSSFVTADPDIAPAVRAMADRYNGTHPIVRDHCAKVVVTSRPTAAVAAGLSGAAWDDRALGPRPALWIPSSSRWVTRVRVPGLIQGDPASLASSPVVVAVPPALGRALTDAHVGWGALATLQQGSLSTIGLDGWGGLGLALPATDATLAVAEQVAESASGVVPLSDAAAGSDAVATAVSAVAAGAPSTGDGDPLTAVAAGDASASPVHAVPATAKQVSAAGRGLVAFRPAGSSALADYPAAVLSGAWVDDVQSQTAVLFARFLAAPAQREAFTRTGFDPPAPTPVPSKNALQRLDTLLAHPLPRGVFSTIVLDTAGATADGDTTGLGAIAAALSSQLDTMSSASGVGLWLAGGESYQVLDATAPLDTTQRGALAAALRTVSASNTSVDPTRAALIAAYRSAVAHYTPDLTNTVLFITAGTGQNADAIDARLRTAVAAASELSKPVRIDVIDIADHDDATLRAVATDTKGAYTRVTSSDSVDFGAAVGKALTP
jgi:hypothetical protein